MKTRINTSLDENLKDAIDAIDGEESRSAIIERYVREGVTRDMSNRTLDTNGLVAEADLRDGYPSPLAGDVKVLLGQAILDIRIMCVRCGRFVPAQAIVRFDEHGKLRDSITIGRRVYHGHGEVYPEPYFTSTDRLGRGREPNNLCNECWEREMDEKFRPVLPVPEPEGVIE